MNQGNCRGTPGAGRGFAGGSPSSSRAAWAESRKVVARWPEPGLGGFVQRLVRGGFDQVGQHLAGGADGEHRVAVPGERRSAFRDQGHDPRMRCERREIGQRSAAPPARGLAEQGRGPARLRVAPGVVRLGDEPADVGKVDVDGVPAQRVTTADMRQELAPGLSGARSGSSSRRRCLEDVHRTVRRPFAPERVRQVLLGHRLAAGEHQQPQHGPAAGWAEFEFRAAAPRRRHRRRT